MKIIDFIQKVLCNIQISNGNLKQDLGNDKVGKHDGQRNMTSTLYSMHRFKRNTLANTLKV